MNVIIGRLFEGFWLNCQLFGLTLLFAIPLGLVVCFGSMNQWAPLAFLGRKENPSAFVSWLAQAKPIAFVVKVFVWIIRGTPLMLQLMIIFMGPGLMFGNNIWNLWGRNSRLVAAVVAFVINYAFAFFLFLGASTFLPSALPADADLVLPEGRKLIALTFDDGPKRSTTIPLLDGLAQRGVPATFFLIGEQIPANEDIVRRMKAEGHQVGIHSYSHAKLTALNQADFDAEVGRARTVLTNILGDDTFFLRPPYGMVDESVKKRANAPIILWSIDPEDWGEKDSDREAAHILSHAEDGAIILLHDIYPESVEAALRAIDTLHAQGYLFLTVSDLFAAKGIPLEAGKVYRSADK